MRALLKSGYEWLRTGWFWAFVLLALPNCALDVGGLPGGGNGNGDPPPPCLGGNCSPTIFQPGTPASDTIVCEFPAALPEGDDGCASMQDLNIGGFSLTEAAIRLATGENKGLAFDYSPGALAGCTNGMPKRTSYYAGVFPHGFNICLNAATQIPVPYATPTDACIAKCQDLIIQTGFAVPQEGVAAYCQSHARTAINYPKDTVYLQTCTNGGTFIGVDPRWVPENMKWTDFIGTEAGGTNTLTRTAPSVSLTFDAGAASDLLIFEGDAWVEFNVTELATAHALMFATSPCNDPFACPDTDPSANFGVGIDLASDSQIYAVEHGVFPGPYGPYVVGERYRLKATDNHDGKATISFARISGTCIPATTNCTEQPLYTSPTTVAYPLRVDAAIRDQFATLTNVTVMRIIPQ
jgi:hypothetical protein